MFEVDLMAEAGMPYIAAGPSSSFAGITTQYIAKILVLLVLYRVLQGL